MKERYISTKDVLLMSVMNGQCQKNKYEDALFVLSRIKKYYITSNSLNQDDEDSISLWVKGFLVSKEEEQEGYYGNYAKIFIEEENSVFSVKVEKIFQPLKFHPQRVSKQRKIMPNWGHPILRKYVLKRRSFEHKHDAIILLKKLHEDYPKIAALANEEKLHLMVYHKGNGKEKFKNPVRKYFFTIEKDDANDVYYIDYKENLPFDKKNRKRKYNQGNSNLLFAYGERSVVDRDSPELSSRHYKFLL